MNRLRAVACAAVLLTCWAAKAQHVFKSGVDLVGFGVTIIDRKGSPVTDLTPDDFVIIEEGKEQKLNFFASGASEATPPLHIGLLFDTSRSMVEGLGFARSAAIKFLNTLTQAVDITLVNFDTEIRIGRYGQADFPRLVERIRSREAEGWTALYDAIGVYLDGASAQDGQKILVLYTDGSDTRSSMTWSEILMATKASDVTVYAIGFLEHEHTSVQSEQRMRLQQMTELSGGQTLFPTDIKDLDAIYEKIQAEITARYSLGYTPTDARTDGSWRNVEIRVTRPDLKGAKVRTRKGYFAPYRPSSDKAHQPEP